MGGGGGEHFRCRAHSGGDHPLGAEPSTIGWRSLSEAEHLQMLSTL